MPHLNGQITPWGPLLNVLVGVSAPRQIALTQANQPVPAPVAARLVVDTGASLTVVDATILAQLGLTPRGTQAIHTPSTKGVPHEANQFDISLFIPGLTPGQLAHFVPALPVIDGDLKPQGIDGLLGRDVLATCRLTYFGSDGWYGMSF